MRFVEAGREHRQRVGAERAGRERDGELVGLTPGPQVGRPGDHEVAVAQLGAPRASSRREHGLQRDDVVGVQVGHVGLDQVDGEVGADQTDGRGDAGRPRHHHRRDVEGLGQPGRVHRAGTAEPDEREVARVDATLHRDDPDRRGHALVDDLVDRPRRLERREPERRRHRFDRGGCQVTATA